MKLSHLRNVVAVSERGSLHAAARHLKITQPALTRSIRELERELRVPLFERNARGVVATEMGERVIRRARAVLSELRHVHEEIDQLQGVAQGCISICLGVLPHLTLLPYAFNAFRAHYPDIHVDIIEGRFPTIEGMLRAGTVDFFIGPLHVTAGKEFTVEKLYDQPHAVLCRKGHPLASARSLRELVHAEWLTNSVTTEPADEIAPLFLRHHLPMPRLVAQSHSALTILVTVGHSDLLVLLPADLVSTSLGGALLQRIDVAEATGNTPIVMIRRASLPLTPAAECFADMFRRAGAQWVRARSGVSRDA
jgi:DNA-binding transcriptional LysR family regulator